MAFQTKFTIYLRDMRRDVWRGERRSAACMEGGEWAECLVFCDESPTPGRDTRRGELPRGIFWEKNIHSLVEIFDISSSNLQIELAFSFFYKLLIDIKGGWQMSYFFFLKAEGEAFKIVPNYTLFSYLRAKWQLLG